MKIGIILGSIRVKRNTETVAKWVAEHAATRQGSTTYELLDLRDFNVPLLSTSLHPMAAKKNYEDPNVQAWSDVVDPCDGFVFVTPEYNHALPGAFKNAVDSLGSEWVGKPVAFVGHGSVGGVRAIEQWRQVAANFAMPQVRAELNFNSFFNWDDDGFAPVDRQVDELHGLLDDLEDLVRKFRE